jgi:hypothetical protein
MTYVPLSFYFPTITNNIPSIFNMYSNGFGLNSRWLFFVNTIDRTYSFNMKIVNKKTGTVFYSENLPDTEYKSSFFLEENYTKSTALSATLGHLIESNSKETKDEFKRYLCSKINKEASGDYLISVAAHVNLFSYSTDFSNHNPDKIRDITILKDVNCYD